MEGLDDLFSEVFNVVERRGKEGVTVGLLYYFIHTNSRIQNTFNSACRLKYVELTV